MVEQPLSRIIAVNNNVLLCLFTLLHKLFLYEFTVPLQERRLRGFWAPHLLPLLALIYQSLSRLFRRHPLRWVR